VIAPPQSLSSTSPCREQYYGIVSHTQQQQQQQRRQWALRQASTVATSNTDKYPISPSNPSSNLPQSSNIDSSSDLPAKCIDFTAASKIEGDESHIATIILHPGETLRAESGSMIFMTEGVVCKYVSFLTISLLLNRTIVKLTQQCRSLYHCEINSSGHQIEWHIIGI
jgi:hypothetical protein